MAVSQTRAHLPCTCTIYYFFYKVCTKFLLCELLNIAKNWWGIFFSKNAGKWIHLWMQLHKGYQFFVPSDVVYVLLLELRPAACFWFSSLWYRDGNSPMIFEITGKKSRKSIFWRSRGVMNFIGNKKISGISGNASYHPYSDITL